ncbi:hypothetical protein PFICI_06871 [Pestalotiopsis fici W106-1]|uniref:Uncharacterized protein n=1 Tax=Pestalotiopsis fici (strain W106-1 / CGMCC3.15140) TaxID=1229662 RepID=W3X763_PESFW|nr:uncharacterized protein PFICI_06871 [Pestalotiopsis fici W106-1]ETS81869.1 hypothetical protein PFICI_06871 [Pestalotiopsis fici W106-1]
MLLPFMLILGSLVTIASSQRGGGSGGLGHGSQGFGHGSGQGFGQGSGHGSGHGSQGNPHGPPHGPPQGPPRVPIDPCSSVGIRSWRIPATNSHNYDHKDDKWPCQHREKILYADHHFDNKHHSNVTYLKPTLLDFSLTIVIIQKNSTYRDFHDYYNYYVGLYRSGDHRDGNYNFNFDDYCFYYSV